MKTLPRPLRGMVPPVLTLLSDRDTLDANAFERLLNHVIEGGASAVFILGSTGELPGLSHRLRRDAIDCAMAATGGRVPVLVGVSDTCFDETLSLAEYAAEKGAAAVVACPPYYFSLSQSMLLGWLERLAAELPLPLYLYNMPAYTKIYIEPDTVRALSSIPGVYGLKDSSGNGDYFRKVRAVVDRPDFSLLTGTEEMLSGMVLDDGAHGGVCGGANLHPRLYADLYEAAAGGDRARAVILQARVIELSAAVYGLGEPQSSYLRGLKCAVSLAGFGGGAMAEPYRAFGTELRDELRAALIRLGIAVAD